jgi:hypothetical protein
MERVLKYSAAFVGLEMDGKTTCVLGCLILNLALTTIPCVAVMKSITSIADRPSFSNGAGDPALRS